MEWISLKNQTPEGKCLAIGYQDEMLIGYIYHSIVDGFCCESDDCILQHVTHWMPLNELIELKNKGE